MSLDATESPSTDVVPVGPTGTDEVALAAAGPTALYTVTSRVTTAVATMTGIAGSREAAIAVAVQAGATGPTGTEAHVWQTNMNTGVTGALGGPTGVYATTWNSTGPLTGATYIGVSREDAIAQAVAAGPTGLGAGMQIFRTTP
jgi:hypothetical protein